MFNMFVVWNSSFRCRMAMVGKGERMRVKRYGGTAGSVPVDTSCVRTGEGGNGGTTEYVGRNVVSSFRIP